MQESAPNDLAVRARRPADLDAAADLWVAAWQAAYPAIDFAARRDWILARFVEMEAGGSLSFVAVLGDRVAGFIIVHPATGYIDQIAVAVACQGRGVADCLLAQARKLSPRGLDLHVNQDNARALRFYEKSGFVVTGPDVNARSGAPTFKMSWRP
jgi:putative acetyltransferase